MRKINFEIQQGEIHALETHSEEVQVIMEKMPFRIIRNGNSLFFLVIAMIVIGSFFFRYPDIIEGRFIIVSSNPPIKMFAKKSGKIVLKVNDRELVRKGQLLASVEDAAVIQDVLWLDQILIQSNYKDSIFNKVLKLGELQTRFSALQKAINDYRNFTSKSYHPAKIIILEERYQIFQSYLTRLKEQYTLKKYENHIVIQELNRDSLLFTKHVTSENDFNQSRQKSLQMKQSLKNCEVSYSDAELKFNEMKEVIVDLKMDYNEQNKQRRLSIDEALENLKGTISEWNNKNLLISPIDGFISFSLIWRSNQYIKEGQLAMNIIPNNQTKLTGKITFPIIRSGKVKQGQIVNLKFDNYPFNEYGMVLTVLGSINQVPDSFYIANIEITDSLITNYGDKIPFGQNMQGTAEIITGDLSLLHRLVNPLKALIKQHI